MKAKHIKKLREKIKKFHPYVIHTALRLFGYPYSEEKEPIIYAKPGDGIHAMRRYCRWYERKYKKLHPNYSENPIVTTCKNGTFEVVDLKTGYKHYI